MAALHRQLGTGKTDRPGLASPLAETDGTYRFTDASAECILQQLEYFATTYIAPDRVAIRPLSFQELEAVFPELEEGYEPAFAEFHQKTNASRWAKDRAAQGMVVVGPVALGFPSAPSAVETMPSWELRALSPDDPELQELGFDDAIILEPQSLESVTASPWVIGVGLALLVGAVGYYAYKSRSGAFTYG